LLFSTYEYNQYYYVWIYEKKPNIHFHNVNNSIHQQLVDNSKNLFLDHMKFAMNQSDDNYNILNHCLSRFRKRWWTYLDIRVDRMLGKSSDYLYNIQMAKHDNSNDWINAEEEILKYKNFESIINFVLSYCILVYF
jgi:hypothetical protein